MEQMKNVLGKEDAKCINEVTKLSCKDTSEQPSSLDVKRETDISSSVVIGGMTYSLNLQ